MSYNVDPSDMPPPEPSSSSSSSESPRKLPAAEVLALATRELTDGAEVSQAFASVAELLFVAEMSGPLSAEDAADLAELQTGIGKLQSLVLDLTGVARRLEARVRADTAALRAARATAESAAGPT
jgi:hypothetical protein